MAFGAIYHGKNLGQLIMIGNLFGNIIYICWNETNKAVIWNGRTKLRKDSTNSLLRKWHIYFILIGSFCGITYQFFFFYIISGELQEISGIERIISMTHMSTSLAYCWASVGNLTSWEMDGRRHTHLHPMMILVLFLHVNHSLVPSKISLSIFDIHFCR